MLIIGIQDKSKYKILIIVIALIVTLLPSCKQKNLTSNKIFVPDVAVSPDDIPFNGEVPENVEIISNTSEYTIARYTIPLIGLFDDEIVMTDEYNEMIFSENTGLFEDKIVYGRFAGHTMNDGDFKRVYKYGIMNSVFKITTHEEYDGIPLIKNGMAVVINNGLYGVIAATDGNLVIPINFENMPEIYMDQIRVKVNEDMDSMFYMYYDIYSGDYIYSFEITGYSNPEKFSITKTNPNGSEIENYTHSGWEFSIRNSYYDLDSELWGYKDGFDQIIIEPVFEEAQRFSEERAVVKINGKYGYIDPEGNIIIDCQFDKAFDFSDGMAAVVINGKYGYISIRGGIVIECKYQFAGDFKNGLAPIKPFWDPWGYINENNDFIIKKYFRNALPFSYGYAPVLRPEADNHYYSYINEHGQYAFNGTTFRTAYPFNEYGCVIATDFIVNSEPNARKGHIDYVYIIKCHN